jgi:hypothetical protein
MNGSRWRTAGASVRGSSHERAGLSCQDSHRWAAVREDILVVTVADGAGSASLAEVGATAAAEAAVEHVCRKLTAIESDLPPDEGGAGWCALLMEALGASRGAVEAQAKARALPLCDLASTLIVAIAGPEAVAAVQVGDGAVVAGTTDSQVFAVTQPTRGEYLNETIFLTSAGVLETVQPQVWRGRLAHLAVFSDGLQMVALHLADDQPHPGFFLPLFRFLKTQSNPVQAQQALASFLASPRLREHTEDDVTLFLATLTGERPYGG